MHLEAPFCAPSTTPASLASSSTTFRVAGSAFVCCALRSVHVATGSPVRSSKISLHGIRGGKAFAFAAGTTTRRIVCGRTWTSSRLPSRPVGHMRVIS